MGQKTNPIGLRLGINRAWDSKWFATKNFAHWLEEDVTIRKYIKKRLARAGVSKTEIERRGDKVRVHIHTARPGMVIGRKGAEVDFLSEELCHLTMKDVQIDIREVKRPELNAQLVAEHIAGQIEQRVSYRRAMKKAIGSAMRMGAHGIKIKMLGPSRRRRDVPRRRVHGRARSAPYASRRDRFRARRPRSRRTGRSA